MRVLPVNLNTILIELDDLAQTLALMASLQAETIAGIEEIVPAARSLLIRFSPAVADQNALVQDIARRRIDGTVEQSGRRIEIPVIYNGEDLEEVGRLVGISADEVIRRHTGTDYMVAFTGFAPGFAYLSGGDQSLNVPRRSSPRPSIPAGSVALAGGFSAVYPQTSPGGWQLIGITDMPMWDLAREQPALLQPGDRVRFTVADSQKATMKPSPLMQEERRIGPLRMRKSARLSLFQDLGRPNQAKQGVSVSGAMDKASLAAANRLVGNEGSEACIEIAYGVFEVVCSSEVLVASAGAQGSAEVTDSYGTTWEASRSAPIALVPGDILKLGEPEAGVYSYLAVRGGFDVPHVLGSSSTDFMAKIGRPLMAGDYLPVKKSTTVRASSWSKALPVGMPKPKEISILDVVMGPRSDWFSQASVNLFTSQLWSVTAQSNRVGLRLLGETSLTRSQEKEGKELASEGTVRGAIQIPAAGQPILFMTDHPLTGGYPVIACVAEYHLDLAGQLPIGAQVRFRPVRAFEAMEIDNRRGTKTSSA